MVHFAHTTMDKLIRKLASARLPGISPFMAGVVGFVLRSLEINLSMPLTL